MSTEAHPAARVVVGDFGAIARAGLRDALRGEGFEVLAVELAEVEGRIDVLRPDAVVLDLDLEGCRILARRLAVAHPGMRVIACSVEEPRMQLFSPQAGEEPRAVRLTTALLASAVRGEQ